MTDRRIPAIAYVAMGIAAIGLAAAPLWAKSPVDDGFFDSSELTPEVALCGKEFYLPTIFGPTGMNGWLLNETLVVREIENGSPADGVVLPNDIIVAVNGVKLGTKMLKTLGEQIEASEQTGRMALTVQRAGKTENLTIPIRKLGAFGKDWPYNCAKSRAIHREAAAYLARIQRTEGLFDGRIFVGFALNGLTWLATDDPAYWEHARRLAYGYARTFNPDESGTVNWGWGYMGVFLAEYYLKTGDEAVLPTCHRLAQALTSTQQSSGTWGHGKFPGGGYVQGGSLNNAGLVCWMALTLFKEAGVPVNEAALARSTKFFKRFAHRGLVSYGDHRPEMGGGNGKNAIPGVVYTILGDDAASEFCGRWVTSGYPGRCSGHTGGYMGFVWGNIQGSRNPHYPDYRRMLDYWKWLQNVARRWDGGFLLPESVLGGYTNRGPILSTGGVAQLYALPAKSLRIHGAPKGIFAKQNLPTDLAEGVELYRDRKFNELRKTVKPTCAMARQLLAAADLKEKDLELTLAKFEAALEGGNATLARRITTDVDAYTKGEESGRGSRNWRLATHEDTGAVDAAATVYNRYKWLTYTHPGARAAFERLADDASAGVYQALARNELATAPHASDWVFFCELMWNTYAGTWQLDDLARAGALRVAGVRGGNWPVVVSANTLHAAGLLQKQLAAWTPLFASATGSYPGKQATWRLLGVKKGETPPAGWHTADFDDSDWTSGSGPLGGRRDSPGVKPVAGCVSYLRINFDCDPTDIKRLLLGLRTQRGRAVVYLNGSPVLWAAPTAGPRMHVTALTMIDLEPAVAKMLRQGKNVLAIRANASSADFGLYASTSDESLGFKVRPKSWNAGPVLPNPDLSVKTAARVPVRTVLPGCDTGIAFDVPGKPNVEFEPLRAALEGRTMPIEERAKYFGYPDARVRRWAAWSLMAEGAKAMPHILKALDSKDVRVIRAGTDALTGGFKMNGRGTPDLRRAMPPEIAGTAVPKLLPLLGHEDVWIRQGALLALSSCGEAATKHLDRIVKLADDEDWWVRAAVGHVLHYTARPKTADYVTATIRNYLTEKSIYGKNRLRETLVGMARRGDGTADIVQALIVDKHIGALADIGPGAKAATPLLNRRIQEAKAKLARAKTDKGKTKAQRNVDNLMGMLWKINPELRPARPPKKRK